MGVTGCLTCLNIFHSGNGRRYGWTEANLMWRVGIAWKMNRM